MSYFGKKNYTGLNERIVYFMHENWTSGCWGKYGYRGRQDKNVKISLNGGYRARQYNNVKISFNVYFLHKKKQRTL